MTVNSLKEELINISSDRQLAREKELKSHGSTDINSDRYDPVLDIMELFDSPNALNDIENLMNYTNLYQLQLEDDIVKQRQEYKELLSQSEEELEWKSLDDQVVRLVESFDNLKVSVESTGHTINSMTENIKELDYSKKNLTFTMTTFKRLQMLVVAYDRLEKQLEKEKQIKKYSEIKQLLSAVLELNSYFQDFKSIDEINELHKQIESLKNKLIQDIFKDFDLEIEDQLVNDELIEACYILEILGDAYKERLQNWYIKTTLKSITEIFTSTEEAGSLDNLNRRFVYFQNILSNFEGRHLKVFPKSWDMSVRLSKEFCAYTKADLKEVLGKETSLKSSSDVNILLNSLSQTLGFEQFLNKKYQYHKDFDEHIKDSSVPDFTRSISDVFEPFLSYWVDSQVSVIDEKIQEFMRPDIMFNKIGEDVKDADKEDNDSINILESAAELFRIYRQMLSQLSKLTTGKTLAKLSGVFGKCLIRYKNKILESILPDSKSFVSVDMESQKQGIDLICLVLNTASYCSSTINQLEEKFKSLINDETLCSKIQFEEANDGFIQLIAYCINLLFYKIENDLQYSWKELANFNWKVLNEVSGESRYITSLKSSIKDNCQYMFNSISKTTYIRNLIDKIVDMLLKNTLANIIKLEPISTIMAEQFKLDLQELKSFVNLLPTLVLNQKKSVVSASFKTQVNQQFKNMDNLMKIMMVSTKPMDVFIDSYFTIIGDCNFANFLKVLQLKGVMKEEGSEKDKFKYMDMFKMQLGLYEEANPESALIESNEFLEKIKLPTAKQMGHVKTNSRSIYLPSTVTGSANSGSNSLLPPEPPLHAAKSMNTETSPKPNFGFFNTTKSFAEKGNFNENFKKLFKRGE